jgi:hypothetical protein
MEHVVIECKKWTIRHFEAEIAKHLRALNPIGRRVGGREVEEDIERLTLGLAALQSAKRHLERQLAGL